MEGSCLCGTITVRTPDATLVDACHCGMCRRWGGGPALGVSGGTDVQIDGAEALRVYRSSEWAERAFCSTCGTHLYYKLLPTGEYFVPVGLFQDGQAFAFKEQIFIDRKPDFYTFANQTHNLTEAEVFARYLPAQDPGPRT
jgi:hypothetical protein